MQETWIRKLNWDDDLPKDLATEFQKWLKHIYYLNDYKVPRRLTKHPIDSCKNTLHIFCDASKHAYAVCIFLRSEFNNSVHLQLVMAKSRVTPVKRVNIENKIVSMGRHELIAATMATRLAKEVKKVLDYECVFWTDSSVALAWIKGDGDWSVFVANRVKEIRSSTDAVQWYHVPGTLNPADLPSRGCNAKVLLENKWWKGPEWLMLDKEQWPKQQYSADSNSINEERKKCLTILAVSDNYILERLYHISKYSKIVRILAWMLRFNKRKNKSIHIINSEELSYDEVQNAENLLFRLIQTKNNIGKNSLQTTKSVEGILKLKTKLSLNDEFDENFKNPIVLPGKDLIISRLILQRLLQLNHAGTQILMADLRKSYLIIGLRRIAKQIISKCVICRRQQAKSCQTPNAPLPVDRIRCNAAFEVTGIDLAGPLILKSREKCWIVLFTCATYRAIHLEMVESLSTESLMMAIRRFIARRGRVATIYSDNGTNFKGLHNQLEKVVWDQIIASSTLIKIKWRFIPPDAPWWGGFWERLVRSVKELLRRVLGKASVFAIELQTILCDIEATINKRPLTYISSNKEDLLPLTPSAFLHSLPQNDVSDFDQIDGKCLNLRVKYVQSLRENLRQRFQKEYLANLVQRGHNQRISILKPGDVVIIENDSKRINWPLGVVEEVFDGSDGHARVARIRTANGDRVRAFQRLYPLEISTEEGEIRRQQISQFSPTVTSPCTPEKSEKLSPPGFLPMTTRSGRVIRVPQRF